MRRKTDLRKRLEILHVACFPVASKHSLTKLTQHSKTDHFSVLPVSCGRFQLTWVPMARLALGA